MSLNTDLRMQAGSSSVPLLVENPLTGGKVAVPAEIRMEGDWVLWRKGPSEPPMEGFVEGGSTDRAIWRFLDLWDATPEQILSFAQEYGVLAIHADGLPATLPGQHQRRNALPPFDKIGDPPVYWYKEKAQAIRMYSVGLRTALAFALELRNDWEFDLSSTAQKYGLDQVSWESFNLPNTDDGRTASNLWTLWLSRFDPGFFLHNLARYDQGDAQQWMASFLTDTWIRWGGLTPVITWEEGVPRMTMRLGPRALTLPLPSNTLMSVVAAQVAALVTSHEFDRVDRCSVCGRLFPAKKKPGRHQRAFCPEHKLEGERERKRRWARKQAEKRSG